MKNELSGLKSCLEDDSRNTRFTVYLVRVKKAMKFMSDLIKMHEDAICKTQLPEKRVLGMIKGVFIGLFQNGQII
jgi:hypothetical protein